MKIGEHIVMATSNLEIRYLRTTENEIHMRESIYPHFVGQEIDVTSRGWYLWILRSVAAPLSLLSRGRTITVSEGDAIFMPPYSLLQWKKGHGAVEIEGYGRAGIPEIRLTEEPVLFRCATNPIPTSLEEIQASMFKASRVQPVGVNESNSAVARKLKNKIDENFETSIPLAHLIEELKLSHAVATRQFRACYCMTPVQYRTKLRLSDSLRRMVVDDQSVAEAASWVGYRDKGKFNRNFKKYFQITPGYYRVKPVKKEVSSF